MTDKIEDQPDYPIYAEIMKCCEEYTGMSGANVATYFMHPYPQRLYTLNHLLRWHQFREEGDIKRFLRLSEQLEALPGRQSHANDHFVVNLAKWLEDSLAEMKPLDVTTPREKVVISVMAWGKDFVQRMNDYLFKSWFADGNMAYLASQKLVILNFHTTMDWIEAISSSEYGKKLQDLGVRFATTIIPKELTEGINRDTIYWLVGASATLGINYAKVNGAAYHHSCPDAIYSSNYFKELLRLSGEHENILQIAMRTDECSMMKALMDYETESALSIPSEDLVAHSLNSLHITETLSLMNNRPALEAIPVGHKLYWESDNTLHMQSPHVNAAWLSFNSIKELPQRFYHSIDSELDLICRGANFYIPKAEDHLYIAELSHQSAYPTNDGYLHVREYGDLFWKVISIRDLLKFFYPGMTIAINRNLRPNAPVMSEKQIVQEKEQLRYCILMADPFKGKKMARERLHDQQMYG